MALIQSASKSAGAVTSSTLAFPTSVIAGHTKYAHVFAQSATASLSASDNIDGAYRQDGVAVQGSGATITIGVHSKPNASAGAATVTFGQGVTTGQLKVVIAERDEKIGAADAIASGPNTSTTTFASGATSTPTTQPSELAIALMGDSTGSATVTPPSGFTADPANTSKIYAAYGTTGASGTNPSATFGLSIADNGPVLLVTYLASGIAAAATDAITATGQLFWSEVTLAGTLYTGPGGILDPTFWLDSVPTVGSRVFYDATFITITPTGEINATTNSCTAAVEFFDGSSWATGTVVITPNMVGDPTDVTTASGALTTAIKLLGAASDLTSAVGSITTGILLNDAATDLTTATAALNTAILLAGSAVDVTTAAALLQNPMRANAVDVTSATAALTNHINMLAAAASVIQAAGAITTGILLAANAIDTTTAHGAIDTGESFVANASDAITASAALVTQIKLAAAALNIVSAAGALSAHIQFAATAVDTISATGDLKEHFSMVAPATDTVNAQASLATFITMSSRLFQSILAQGALVTGINLSGNAQSLTEATGNLFAPGSPVGLYALDPYFVIMHKRERFTSRFPRISPGAQEVLSWDFADDLVNGEQLTGIIQVGVACTAGADATPAAHLQGVPAYDPTQTYVEVPFANGVDDCDYYFTVTAKTTNPYKVLTRFGLLQVRG